MTPEQVASSVDAIIALNVVILAVVGGIAGVRVVTWLWYRIKLAIYGPGHGARWM